MILFIIGFVFFQLFVIMVIAYFLRRALQNNLVEIAIHQFEVSFAHELDPDIDEIEVIVFTRLKHSFEERIRQAASRKFKKTVKLSIKQDKAIKGGLILKIGDKIIDSSLYTRLKECGWAK